MFSSALFLRLAEGQGFEPWLTGPEPVVLPLDDPSFDLGISFFWQNIQDDQDIKNEEIM